MADLKELKRIKKKYGEDFMRLCRDLFPTILEQEGRLEEILYSTFAGNSRTLYEDIVNAGLEADFKNYIYSKIDIEDPDRKIIVGKSPYELLDEAGYDLYECLTEEQVQEFRKYYKPREELCTFDGGRLEKCVVFFAVKKNAEDIKRENFRNPKREDEYGTSVMGIQFNRHGLCTVSIKNRYNHAVNNPDATYGNDLDRIVPGLTQSFADLLKKEYNLDLNNINVEKFNIPNYVVASDGRYYKYNMAINRIYYCPGSIMICFGDVIKPKNLESQIVMDYFVLDMKKKTIKLCDESIGDSFIDSLQDLQDAQITIGKTKKKSKIITIQKPEKKPIIIEVDDDNQIIGYENHELKQVRNNFLYDNRTLVWLNLPNVIQVGDNFLHDNEVLKSLNVPNLEQIGSGFLFQNKGLESFDAPKLKVVGYGFFLKNEVLRSLNVPNLEQVGNSFLYQNKGLGSFDAPKLKVAGNDFLYRNEVLRSLNAPNLEQVGSRCLFQNKRLDSFDATKLKIVGNDFLYRNEVLKSLNLPDLEEKGTGFLWSNLTLSNTNSIDSKNIAILDKNNKVTESEMNLVKRIINRFRDSFKNMFKNSR